MQVQIKFTTYGGNPLLGEFSPCDTARVSAELAKHFVEVCKCAKYMEKPAAQVAPVAEPVSPDATPEPPADAPKRGRPKKSP